MTPPRVLAAAGVSAGGNPGTGGSASFRGASGTPPPTVCPGTGGSGRPPLIRPCGATFPQEGRQGLLLAAAGVSAGGNPGDGCWREVSRGVGDAAPYGLPGNGRQREPAPTPAAGPRCGAGGSGCSTSGLTKPALYRRNLGRCRGGSRR